MARVFVTSVPAEFKDLVEVYAESESRGGGRFAGFTYDPIKQCVSIEFVDETDARRFIEKKSLVILGHGMTIMAAPSETTIFVYDVPHSFKDDLDCILESPRKGGGPIKDFDFMDDLRCAKVTFEEKAVAKHFVEQSSLKIGNERLSISFLPPDIYRPKFRFSVVLEIVKKEPFATGEETSLPSSLNSTPPDSYILGACDESSFGHAEGAQAERGGSLVLRAFNLPPPLSGEYLRMALENRRFGGGTLKSYDFIQSEKAAIFSFEDDRVGQEMLKKSRIVLDKNIFFQVEAFLSCAQDSSRRNSREPASLRHPGSAEMPESRMVGLRIESEMTENAVMLYAENKRSNGGPIERIYEIKPKTFVLQFKSAKDARSFCSGNHSGYFRGRAKTIMLEQWPEGVRPCAINVTGFDKITTETLKLFFENQRSGGRPDSVDQVFVRNDVACITFKDPAVVSNILAKGEWKYGQQELKVVACVPSYPPPLLDPGVEVDAHWLRFTEIRLPSLNHREFKEYISLAAQSPVIDVCFEKESYRALARFQDVPDYRNVLETLYSRPFQGIMISVERLAVCDAVLVTSRDKCSQELLRLYFESPRSGGGQIKEMRTHPGMLGLVIQFEDTKVVNQVLEKPHKCDDINLTVKAYRDDQSFFL